MCSLTRFFNLDSLLFFECKNDFPLVQRIDVGPLGRLYIFHSSNIICEKKGIFDQGKKSFF